MDKYDDQPVRIFKRFYRCPKCDNGHVEFTGCVLMSMPAQYQHRCLQCQNIFSLPEQTGSIHYEYLPSENV